MIANKQFLSILFAVLLISAEWGAKCEVEKIPFVAEVGRYVIIHLDSWISSSTLSILRKKSSWDNLFLMHLMHLTKSSLWRTPIQVFWETRHSYKLRYSTMRIEKSLRLSTMVSEWPKMNLSIIWVLLLNQEQPSFCKIWRQVNSTWSDNLASVFIHLFWLPPKLKSSQNITTIASTNGCLLHQISSQLRPMIPFNSREVLLFVYSWNKTQLSTANTMSWRDWLKDTVVLLTIPSISKR